MTREKTLEILSHDRERLIDARGSDYSGVRALDMAIKAFEQTRWIPVSERVPEERKKCLVTFKGGYVGIMYYASDLYRVDEYDFCDEKGMAGWYDYDRELGHYSRDDVIAWMPLPESYKAESEVDS